MSRRAQSTHAPSLTTSSLAMLLLAALFFAQSLLGAPPAPPIPDRQFQQWMRELGSNDFKKRENASRALSRAGKPAIRFLVKGAQSNNVEVRHRAIHVLAAVARSRDQQAIEPAINALRQIARGDRGTHLNAVRRLLSEVSAIALKEAGAHIEYDRKGAAVRLSCDSPFSTVRGRTVDRSAGRRRWKVDDVAMIHVKQLSTLRILSLSGSRVTAQGLLHIGDLPQLEELYLRRTAVTDDVIKQLAKLKHLRVLDLSSTRISDKATERIADLTHLKWLDLSFTAITDNALADLAKLQQLQTLRISATKITDQGVAQLRKQLPETKISH